MYVPETFLISLTSWAVISGLIRSTTRFHEAGFFFKFFTPLGFDSWARFLKNEWKLFLNDAAQIKNSTRNPTSHPRIFIPESGAEKNGCAAEVVPLAADARRDSRFARVRRAFIPLIYWQAKQRSV